MPTLTQYIRTKINARIPDGDIVGVRWYDEGLARWRELSIPQALAVFSVVQVADVTAQARQRIQIVTEADLIFVYDATIGDFVTTYEQDAAFVLSESDLTG